MRKLDNFNLLEPFIDFPNEDVFYYFQIMRRGQDHPNEPKSFVNKVIRNYFVNSKENYENLKPHIIRHCEDSRARCYVRLNKRSKRKTGLRLIQKVADLVMNEQFDAIRSAFDSVSGEFHNDPDKKWLIDFDFKTEQDHFVFEKFKQEYGENAILEIPTFNGMHIISKPFDLSKFKQNDGYSNVEIKKDNPTVLYGVIP